MPAVEADSCKGVEAEPQKTEKENSFSRYPFETGVDTRLVWNGNATGERPISARGDKTGHTSWAQVPYGHRNEHLSDTEPDKDTMVKSDMNNYPFRENENSLENSTVEPSISPIEDKVLVEEAEMENASSEEVTPSLDEHQKRDDQNNDSVKIVERGDIQG